MTTVHTKALVRGILEALREDITDEASWAAIQDLAQEEAFDGYSCHGHGLFVRLSEALLREPNECLQDKVWTVHVLCEFVADKSRSRIQEVDSYSKYREPGYDLPVSGVVAVGNWDSIKRWNEVTDSWVVEDDTPELFGDLLEALDIAIERSDEWTSCSNCSGLVRTQPNSWHWQPGYSVCDGKVLCYECRPPHTSCAACGSDMSVTPAGILLCPVCLPGEFGEPDYE